MCMIAKNEESVLKRCLDSYSGLFDEIIIVDTGSTDNTKNIAAGYTDKIYDFEWTGDFSEARNFAFSKASCDYIFSADADEVLDDYNRNLFMRLKSVLLPEIDIVQSIIPKKNCVRSCINVCVHLHGFHRYTKQCGCSP